MQCNGAQTVYLSHFSYLFLTFVSHFSFQIHSVESHGVRLRICRVCPRLLTKAEVPSHKMVHNQQYKVVAKQAKAATTVKRCDYCECTLTETRHLHLRSCYVRWNYKKLVTSSARAKWIRFKSCQRRSEGQVFYGFSDNDLNCLDNPYDYYFAPGGLKTFNDLKVNKRTFFFGPEYEQ